jgi:hypothetical protein
VDIFTTTTTTTIEYKEIPIPSKNSDDIFQSGSKTDVFIKRMMMMMMILEN